MAGSSSRARARVPGQIEALVCGNLREDEALQLLRTVQTAVPAAPLPPERSPRRRVAQLPRGARTRQLLAPNPDEQNSALEVYFQARAATPPPRPNHRRVAARPPTLAV